MKARNHTLLPLAAVAIPLAISIHSASASTVVPIAGTGFSKDIFADKDGTTPDAVTNYNGFARWVYMEEGAPNIPAGLRAIPSSGMITSKNATPFQLQPVDQNNVLLNGDTFTLNTPARFEDLHFWVTGIGGNGANNFQATVNFTDSSSASFQFTCNDWQASRDYDATDSKWAIVRDSWTGVFGSGVWTRELVFDLSPEDEAKIVVSIDFVLADRLGLSAVSGTTAIQEPPFPLTITPNATNPGNYDFRWDSKDGKLYDLVSDTGLATAPDTWAVWDGRDDIPSEGTTTSLTDVPGGGDPARFFVVVEKNPPPLLEEDFEAVTNPGPPTDWSYDDNTQGTAWSVGTPDGTSTEPDAAANGTQCAGTNMNGDYTKSAVASIITKAFTVPASGATLSFSQYIDTEVAPSGDFGSIRLLNADDTVLTGGDIATGIEGITEVWSSVSDLPLPAVANGLSVKIEFRFESDADDDVFAGFYIDDVVVTGN